MPKIGRNDNHQLILTPMHERYKTALTHLRNNFSIALKHMEERYTSYLAAIAIFIGGMITLFVINRIMGALSSAAFVAWKPSLGQFMALRVLYLLVAWVVGLIFMAFVQALWVNISLKGGKISETIKISLSRLKPFTLLTLIIGLATALAFSPLYGIVLVYFFNTFAQNILLVALLVMLIVLLVVVSVYFVFTPYLMLDKNLTLKETFVANKKLISSKEGFIFGSIAFFAIAFVALNLAFFPLLVAVPGLGGMILNLIVIFFVLPYAYSYFACAYNHLRG